MLINLFHHKVGLKKATPFFFEILLVITGIDGDISNNIQKIYSLFAGAWESKRRSLRVLYYEVYELKSLSVIYYSPCAFCLHLVGEKK